MPRDNRFHHQSYPTSPTINPVLRRVAARGAENGNFGRLHDVHEVHRIVLVHGTFLGDDPFGVSEILRRVAASAGRLGGGLTSLADRLAAATRSITTSVAKDVGNYSAGFRDHFQALTGEGVNVELMEPGWSSQNHHVARADLAIRLLLLLADGVRSPEQRVLLWGHSHAGNGFALLSNLLANDRQSVERFFEAAGQQEPHWQQARALLAAAPTPHPLAQAIDIAAFGTPVRYGWDTAGYRSLIHVLHHREADAANPIRTKPLFPPHRLQDTLSARYGDWVQAFAIAGTDVPTGTSFAGHKRLGEVLTTGLAEPQHGLDTRFIAPPHVKDACARWKTGTRCHADGLNLLLDYEPCGRRTRTGQPVEQAMLGHGVATTVDWLPTHLRLVVEGLDSQFRQEG